MPVAAGVDYSNAKRVLSERLLGFIKRLTSTLDSAGTETKEAEKSAVKITYLTGYIISDVLDSLFGT
jgi:hypothetical protein